MASTKNKSRAKEWLWPRQATYRPNDRIIWTGLASVALVALIIIIQFVSGLNSPNRPVASRPVSSPNTTPIPKVGTNSQIGTPSTAGSATTLPPVLPPDAIQILQTGAAASLDGAWASVKLVPGLVPPPGTVASVPQAAPPVPGPIQTISATNSQIVANMTVTYQGVVHSVLGRAILESTGWAYQPG